jgi:peptidoglycan-associated lipoprotein
MTMRRTRWWLATSALALAGTACHHAAPAVAPPVVPTARATGDPDAAARLAAARRDSVARAAALRDSIARAENMRRERDAAAARSALSAQVYFDFDRDELRPDAEAALSAKVPVLQANSALRIRIEGNADDRGSDEYNLALGQRRSAAAKRYLVSRGIDAARIDVVSYGEERPVCRDDAESCWHLNRRDEFTIVAGGERLAGQRE